MTLFRVLVVLASSLAAAGCVQTSRVADELASPAKLTQARKAIAVMRIGAAGTACDHVAVLLGVRDGTGFRYHTPIRVANVRSIVEPAVAETELEPGEYHVIAYQCTNAQGVKVLSGSTGGDMSSAGGRLFATSYASFRLEAGEIVNVGFLHIGASLAGRSQFGRPLRIEVDVTDWPLAELERYKAKRPAIYAQMRTRLMKNEWTASRAPSQDDCGRLRQLLAEGKVQALPPACTSASVAKPARGT